MGVVMEGMLCCHSVLLSLLLPKRGSCWLELPLCPSLSLCQFLAFLAASLMTDGHSIYLSICVRDFCLSFPLLSGYLLSPSLSGGFECPIPGMELTLMGVVSDLFPSLPSPGRDVVMAGDDWYGCRGVL